MMSKTFYTAHTLLTTFGHLVRGDPQYTQILLGVTVLAYLYILEPVLETVLAFTTLLVKALLLFMVSRPYRVLSLVLMRRSRNMELGAQTRAALVTASVLCMFVTYPTSFNADLDGLNAYSEWATRVLNMVHKRITWESFTHNFQEGLQLPSYIDVIKCVCLSVLAVAAFKQSNENPEPTMLDALLS